jgi:hypothetical protein
MLQYKEKLTFSGFVPTAFSALLEPAEPTHPATPCSVLAHMMPAMQMQQPQRQALGVIQGNRPAPPLMQAPIKPGTSMVVNAGYHMRPAPQAQPPQQQMPVVLQKVPVMRSAQPREENMVIIEVVRKPQKPDTVHAEVARGFQIVRKDAPMQRPFSGSAPVQGTGSDDISVGKTISVKETTFIRGPMKAENNSFQLEEVRAQVQIQPPTPLAVANARQHAEDIKQANRVEQWLANQQPPAAVRHPRSENSDAHSTRSADARSDAQSICEVKNVGSTRAARNFDQMPAPGSFMQGGPGEGPGLVC